MRVWADLSHPEQCLMVNAAEHDLLPSVMWDWRTDLDFADRLTRYAELARTLIGLVDQGLVQVHLFSDEIVGSAELPAVLADPAVWHYTDHNWMHRDEGLFITETPAGRQLTRTSPPGVPDPQSSNPSI